MNRSEPRKIGRISTICFALLILACSESPSSRALDDVGEVSVDEGLDISHLIVVQNPANALSYYVEWRTNVPASARLDVSCGSEYQRAFVRESIGERHSVFVMGLIDGVECSATISASTADRDRYATATVPIGRPGPISDYLPELTVREHDDSRAQPGWTLLTPSGLRTRGPMILALVDELGRYRWYHLLADATTPGAGIDAQILPRGVLVGGRYPRPRAALIGWEGDVLWEAPFASHHAIEPSPFHDDHLLYLGKSRSGCPDDSREDTIGEFDVAGNETIWTWRICDHYSPPVRFDNWSHINAIEPFPGEPAVLISVRNQNNLMRVNRETDEIEWILGRSGDFEMDDGDYFMRQHSPHILSNGNILLFDNGFGDVRAYSRAIELAMTFDDTGAPLRAEVVWEYTDMSLFARVRSDADRLPNGNTLITYSSLELEDRELLVLEVTPDHEVVWELRSEPYWSTYRTERVIEPSYGFFRDIE